MAVFFNWKISALDLSKKHEKFQDLVMTVHWRLEATDETDDTTVDVFGADSLEEPSEGSFTKFEDITKDMVVSWLEAKFSSENVELEGEKNRLDYLKEVLEKQLEEKRQPAVVTSRPPWEE